jgi:hypothetical protein
MRYVGEVKRGRDEGRASNTNRVQRIVKSSLSKFCRCSLRLVSPFFFLPLLAPEKEEREETARAQKIAIIIPE